MSGTTTKTDNLNGRGKFSATDCDWVIANEAEFEKRITEFLAKTKLKDPADGVEKNVSKIQVTNWRCWSANGTKKTAHAKIYEWDEGGQKFNPGETTGTYGITRPWADMKDKKVSFGRTWARR